MTQEQMQSTMQFIIEQQSRFVGDMQAMQETMQAMQQAMQEHSRKTDDRIRTLTDALVSLTRITEENENLLNSLAKEMAERFRETDQKIARLAELGEGTEARLNGFITFVEKYIQSRDGGRT